MDTAQQQQNPIVSYEQPVSPQLPSQQEDRSIHVSKKYLLSIGIILFFIGIGSLLFLKNKANKTPPIAQFNDVLLATVGDHKIYKSEVIQAAGEQYAPNAITTPIIKKFYDIVIERTILDTEAKRLQIVITDTDVTQAINKPSINSASSKTTVKYQLLKTAIIQKNVTSADAYLIGYWLPPLNYRQIPLFDQQRQIGKQALNEGKTMLSTGEKPLSVAKKLYDKYPVLQQILAINGVFINKLKDATVGEKPLTITKGHTDIDTAIFSLRKGDISIVESPNGAGASLVQIVSVNSGTFKDYNDWLANKEKTEVRVITSL
jgi:hypothetical protein